MFVQQIIDKKFENVNKKISEQTVDYIIDTLNPDDYNATRLTAIDRPSMANGIVFDVIIDGITDEPTYAEFIMTEDEQNKVWKLLRGTETTCPIDIPLNG